MMDRHSHTTPKRSQPRLWGFPVPDDRSGGEERADETQPAHAEPKVSRGERGIALMICLIIIMMLMMFTSDMMITSSVELKLAAAKRDEVKAEYLAKSGINLAQFLILADFGVDLTFFKTLKTLPADGVKDLWDIEFLKTVPIGPSAAKLLQSGQGGFKLSKVVDSKVFDQLNWFDGDFTMAIEDEGAKININECAVGKGIDCLAQLNNLLGCPAEARFLAQRDQDPAELAAHIKDWADFRSTPAKGAAYSHEDDPYDRLDNGQKPKNDYFDSVDELLQVAGWDDDIHKVFAPFLTVYPLPSQKNANDTKKAFKININSAKRELVSCLLKSYNGCEERAAIGASPLETPEPLKSQKAVAGKLDQVFCNKDKAKWFTFRSDVFRIKARGAVGDTVKTIETVVQRRLGDKKRPRLGDLPAIRTLYWNSQ